MHTTRPQWSSWLWLVRRRGGRGGLRKGRGGEECPILARERLEGRAGRGEGEGPVLGRGGMGTLFWPGVALPSCERKKQTENITSRSTTYGGGS